MCYIDDIVIPNVFKTIESRNNKLYITVDFTALNLPHIITIIILQDGYYNGFSFAEEITKKFKDIYRVNT